MIRKLYAKPISFIMLLVMSALIFSGCSFTYDIDTSQNDTAYVSISDESIAEDTASENEDSQSTAADIVSDIDESSTTDTDFENEESEEDNVYYTFRNDKLLNEHFEKHNEDFGYADVQEYVDGANRVIKDKDSLHKLEKEDGDDVYYLESTNEFVIVSTDGYIRTYFKPTRGIAYYYNQ